MHSYDWTCANCKASVAAEYHQCQGCGCPAEISRLELERFKSGEESKETDGVNANLLLFLSTGAQAFYSAYWFFVVMMTIGGIVIWLV